MMDKKTFAVIIMAVIILAEAGVMAYYYIQKESYQSGINDAVIIINEQMLDNLRQQGYIPYIIPINETAWMSIKLIPQFYEQP